MRNRFLEPLQLVLQECLEVVDDHLLTGGPFEVETEGGQANRLRKHAAMLPGDVGDEIHIGRNLIGGKLPAQTHNVRIQRDPAPGLLQVWNEGEVFEHRQATLEVVFE